MEVLRAYIRDRIAVEDCGHATSCWLWARCTFDGYGKASIGGRVYRAHRVSYEAFRGEIPQGLHLDHLCCITNCVNPDHLEPVTSEENQRRKCSRRGYVTGGKVRRDRERGLGKQRKSLLLPTHCKKGHAYTPETIRRCVNGRGYSFRACRICLRIQSQAKKQRLREMRTGRPISLPGGVGAKRNASPSYVAFAQRHDAGAKL